MKEATGFIGFLNGIGEADRAVEITKKAAVGFYQVLNESDLDTEALVLHEVRGGKTIVSTDDPIVLAQLLALAENCGVTGVSVVPRITPALILASHGQGKIEHLKNRDEEGDLGIVRVNNESVVVEFTLDAGCRNAARTIAIECVMVDGRAKPKSYCLNQYTWNGRGLSHEKSQTFDSKAGASEAIVCGWKTTDDITANISDQEKKTQATDEINERIRRTIGRLAFLTGLALGKTHRQLTPRREYSGPLGHQTFKELLKQGGKIAAK